MLKNNYNYFSQGDVKLLSDLVCLIQFLLLEIYFIIIIIIIIIITIIIIIITIIIRQCLKADGVDVMMRSSQQPFIVCRSWH